jgi:hypothetical protein
LKTIQILLATICIGLLTQTSLAEEIKPPSEKSENQQITAAIKSAAKTIKPHLPSGWSLKQTYNKIIVLRDFPIMYIQANPSIHTSNTYTIILRFGPLVAPDAFAKLLFDNAKTRRLMDEMRENMNHINHAYRKFDSYLPKTFEEEKLVNSYNHLKNSLKDPPNYRLDQTSIWVRKFDWRGMIAPSEDPAQCYSVRRKVLALFEKHQLSEEDQIKYIQDQIKHIESQLFPTKGTSRQEVESRFGKSIPPGPTKTAAKLADPSKHGLCLYRILHKKFLFVKYSNGKKQKVIWAKFTNSNAKKERAKELTAQERLEELKLQLKQMQSIMTEYKLNWSAAVNGLKGRLVVTRPKISPSERFHINLQLKNCNKGGGPWLAVQAGNPFLFEIQITNADGKPVQPTSGRVDVFYSPSWKVIRPSLGELSIPVTISDTNWSKGAHLDTTTKIWQLAKGKYRISATYSSPKNIGYEDKDSVPWTGKLNLVPIEVEIADIPPLPRRYKTPEEEAKEAELLKAIEARIKKRKRH